MIAAIVFASVAAAVVLWLRRRRRKTGVAAPRTFAIEPPAGRLGNRKGQRL
jgi:hypothetical protein